MHDKPRGAGDDPRTTTTAAEDDRTEAAVLREILFLYPESMRQEELIRQMTTASAEFPEVDQVQRAVRELIAAGLLHQVGDLVLRPGLPSAVTSWRNSDGRAGGSFLLRSEAAVAHAG